MELPRLEISQPCMKLSKLSLQQVYKCMALDVTLLSPKRTSFRFTKQILNLLQAGAAHKNSNEALKLQVQDIVEAIPYVMNAV